MELAVESLEENWNEMILLAVDHWHETGRKHGEKFAPSYSKFVEDELAGRLVMYTARVKGEMIGYATRGSVNSHFLLPKYRKLESNLLKFAEGLHETCCV